MERVVVLGRGGALRLARGATITGKVGLLVVAAGLALSFATRGLRAVSLYAAGAAVHIIHTPRELETFLLAARAGLTRSE